jgi:nucleotide-binding universal stress UspA family protein
MTPQASGGVVVPGDLSSQGVQAAWRAALVARDLATPLRLLHARGASADAPAAAESIRQLANDIRAHMGLRVDVEEDAGDALPATLRAARCAGLVVIGSRRGNPLREFMLGTQAERLIRLCRVPVLVVKRPPGGAYRRVLVPVELGPAAPPVIAAAARLSRGPRLEVLHALAALDDLGMRVFDVSPGMLRRLRRRAASRAEALLEDLIAQCAPHADAAVAAVQFGEPAALVLARAQTLRADLLVLGKRRRGLLADVFLGSVTQRVLADAAADVLVLPPARPDAREPAGFGLLRA